MTKGNRSAVRETKIALTVFALTLILISDFAPQFQPKIIPLVHAQGGSGPVTLSPANNWGPFVNTIGDVQVNLNKSGIAVRIEIPREFIDANGMSGSVVSRENDTHFIESDIRNDYYYYSVIDESLHWSYAWKGAANTASCFKPGFSLYDPNAPWCVEIWNFLNETFQNFTAPRFIRFHGLNAPSIAGVYNFTVFVADHVNQTLAYPDFVHAWNETIRVPVSMKPHPGSVNGTIYDCVSNEIIAAKGVVYALTTQGAVVAKAYVNQANGRFNLTGLDRAQTYIVQGSAGPFRESNGAVWAFSLTPYSVNQCSGQAVPVGVSNSGGFALFLRRAPQIWGIIRYHNSMDQVNAGSQINALTGHPWLTKIDPNIQVLNVTVEAQSVTNGAVYRNQSLSHTLTSDPSSDKFEIITGSGVKYVGTNPYGTEFAGLPQTGSLAIRVWVTGYQIRQVWTVTVSPPLTGNPNTGSGLPDIWMDSTGVIRLSIQFVRDGVTLSPASPHDAEVQLGISPVTDTAFGGNIVIKTYNSAGLLRGITVTNGTFPDGRTRYATSSSVTYYVIGYSEYYNRTWSGLSQQRDYGLPLGDSYSPTVFVRGYEQVNTPMVTIGSVGDRFNATVYMKMGGAILVAVESWNNRFGSRALQAVQPWRFLNLSIPIRARVYFYETGRTIGYLERLMVTHIPNGVNATYFRGVFAGQNWSLRDIWFLNLLPTHITDATYTIRGFTLGYVQQRDVTVPASPQSLSRAYVPLLIGNGIGLIGSLFSAPPPQAIFLTTPEHDHIIADAFNGGGLVGALPGNLSAGLGTLRLPIFGFGAMVINTTFTGQGHFFYEPPDGNGCVNYGFSQDFNHCFDYGLDVGGYTAQIPEFGFNKHFMQLPTPLSISFTDLGFSPDPAVYLIAMGKITQGVRSTGPDYVSGEVPGEVPVPLSWIRVEATNGTFIGGCSPSLSGTIDRCVPTLDGIYDGVGAMFLPQGVYNVTLSDLAGFCASATTTIVVGWSSESSFSGMGPLTCEDPPSSTPAPASQIQPSTQQNSVTVPTNPWPSHIQRQYTLPNTYNRFAEPSPMSKMFSSQNYAPLQQAKT